MPCPSEHIQRRNVVVGRNSAVWQQLAPRLASLGCRCVATGHRDIGAFAFAAGDRVWVLSYSRRPEENTALLSALGHAGVSEIIYVSSSSAIVSGRTACYEYPRVKQLAERDALALANGRVLVIGMVYERAEQLPGGATVATSCDALAAFMAVPAWPARRRTLFDVVQRPFRGPFERVAHRWYGRLMARTGTYPCLLRPLDVLLRALGLRWYGYTYLSNTLWMSTTW